MSKFPERLEKALQLRNMSKTVLADKMGVDKSNVTNYVKGKYAPKIDAIDNIAEILDVRPEWLVGYSDTMEKNEKFDKFCYFLSRIDLNAKEMDRVYNYALEIKKSTKTEVLFYDSELNENISG